jgi:KUP system potassium uptake protein
MGQIYVPWINWLLLVSVLTLVVTFKSSAALA